MQIAVPYYNLGPTSCVCSVAVLIGKPALLPTALENAAYESVRGD